MLGDHLFAHLYAEYIIFYKTKDDSLIQVSGTNIFSYLSEKFGRQALYEQAPADNVLGASMNGPLAISKKQKDDAKSHKYNLKNDTDMYQLNLAKTASESYINRNRLFYCSHQNRKNAFFNKHILNSKTASPQDLAQKIFDEQFGFVRIRRSLRESVLRLIQTVVVN